MLDTFPQKIKLGTVMEKEILNELSIKSVLGFLLFLNTCILTQGLVGFCLVLEKVGIE